MTISLKCSCGNALNLPDDSAGRDAWCPSCRKKVPVPAQPGGLDPLPSAAPDRREASEFRPGALAQLLDTGSGAGRKPEPPSQSPSSSPQESKPAAAPPPGPTPGQSGAKPAAAPVIEIFPDKVKFHCECGQKVSVKLPAPNTAGKCPKCGRSLRVPRMPGAQGAAAPAASDKDEASRERSAARERINCDKCGRRIEDLSAAFCPRCGFPLSKQPPAWCPGAPAAAQARPAAAPENVTPRQPTPQVPASAMPPSTEVRQRNAREAAEAAAELLRPAAARTESGPTAPEAGLVRRLAAFVIDAAVAAAAGLLALKLAPSDGGELPWKMAVIGLAAMLVINEVLFAATAGGRSLGLLVCGAGVFRSSGQPAGPVVLLARLLAWAVLMIGSPLALFDARRRTLHDLVCGTVVLQTSRE
ncbi:MAG TPA: RDD family protein [Planctomycetota bacterium]|nr:RDD family protein [Planctomycetota bacterium]